MSWPAGEEKDMLTKTERKDEPDFRTKSLRVLSSEEKETKQSFSK